MNNSVTVGFIGNPNCGKTTLFNAYTGANLKVANWPGVTVEKKEGHTTYEGQDYTLIDLPGIYSLTSYTMEEKVSRECILSDEVDVIIDVADASSLERNLYLTLQLIELGKPVILALNMMDIVEERGMEIDLHRLPEMLGIPVIPVSARKKTGLSILMHAVAHHKDVLHQDPLIHHHPGLHSKHRHDHHAEYTMVYTDDIEDKIDILIERITHTYPDFPNKRWLAIKYLEKDTSASEQWPLDTSDILDCSYEKDLINQKYDFIEEIIGETLVNMMQNGGPKTCNYGCIGEGTCVKACPFDAIHIVDGVAVVDKEKCKACGKCIAVCPRHLIELIPYEQKHMVQCSSQDKGKDVMAACAVGCIGCRMCAKVCPAEAITVENNIAHIDSTKCVNCGACAEKCPKKIIRIQ